MVRSGNKNQQELILHLMKVLLQQVRKRYLIFLNLMT